MICKVFQYEFKNGSNLYINAHERANPELVLKLYIDWYNKNFAPKQSCPKRNFEDFKFICSFHPVNFYKESVESLRG